MPITAAEPFSAFLAGRQTRQQEEYGNTRNALARMEAEQMPTEIANRNRMADMQAQQYSQEQVTRALQQTAAGAMRIAQSQNPQAEAAAVYPEFAAKLREQNPDWDRLSPEEARQYAGWIAGQAQSKLGIAPAAPEAMTPYQKAQIDIERDKLNQPKTMSPYEQGRIDIERQKLSKPEKQGGYRTLTPAEIEKAGLPAGTSAQVDQNGKIEVLSKRDTSATLSQKDANTAKLKLNAVKIARSQLQKIKSAYESGIAGIGPNAFGGAQGLIPTQAGKKFDAAVDQMRSTLTALTRVPGVGAMSDYETRLDQAKFPSRSDYESVTAEKIQGIDDMLNAIESGYSDMLSGGSAAMPPKQSEPAGEVRVNSPEEAMALPPGTVFITPDGRRKVR